MEILLPRMKYTHEIIGTHRGALLLEHAPGAKSLVCIDLYTNFIRLLNINYKDWANVTILTCDFTILSSINSLFFFLLVFFKVWNSVGIVRCHMEDEISSIEVEFHDTSTHHPLHLTNHLNHSMAALSSTALLLACKAQDDLPR